MLAMRLQTAVAVALRRMASTTAPTYETLAVSKPRDWIAHVQLNRPDRLNAFNAALWRELSECFSALGADSDTRVVVLSGSGKHFTAGIDLVDMMSVGGDLAELADVGRKARHLERLIDHYQRGITALETCPKPVIAAVHAACVGAGVDLITAADVRCCSRDAWFQVKEVDIGMAADVGTLQRLPKAIGSASLARELCLTARKFRAEEALACGFVSTMFDDRDKLLEGAMKLAEEMAARSPIAVQATKQALNYSRDHTVQEGLDHVRLLNMALLQSEDFATAVGAAATKGEMPVFSKL